MNQCGHCLYVVHVPRSVTVVKHLKLTLSALRPALCGAIYVRSLLCLSITRRTCCAISIHRMQTSVCEI